MSQMKTPTEVGVRQRIRILGRKVLTIRALSGYGSIIVKGYQKANIN